MIGIDQSIVDISPAIWMASAVYIFNRLELSCSLDSTDHQQCAEPDMLADLPMLTYISDIIANRRNGKCCASIVC